MGSFRTRPLSSLLLIGLLAWFVVVLIAPQIDLDDVAFRRNDSPLAIHALTCHTPLGNAAVSALGITLPSAKASDLALKFYFFDRAAEASSTPSRILRC
jgi:hypothetical protein